MRVSNKPIKDNWPKVRVSLIADRHLAKLVYEMKKKGLVVTKTSLASEAILSIQFPNGHVTQVPAAEVRKMNQEAKA